MQINGEVTGPLIAFVFVPATDSFAPIYSTWNSSLPAVNASKTNGTHQAAQGKRRVGSFSLQGIFFVESDTRFRKTQLST